MNLLRVGKRKTPIAFAVLLVALIFWCAPGTAMAQCPLCRLAFEGSSQAAMMGRGLNVAILVLLVPPVTIFCSFFIVAYKRRKGGEGDESQHDDA